MPKSDDTVGGTGNSRQLMTDGTRFCDAVLLIRDQMTAQGIQKDQNVTQISLSNRGLSDLSDLSQYKKLNHLWLNGNRLRTIDALGENYRLAELYLQERTTVQTINGMRENYKLAELYLQDNELVNVKGALSHLTNLRILMLQNNQLTRLEETVNEFKFMQALETLNMSKNPLAQDAEYRYYTIFHVPSLKLLDRREVKKSEREEAAKIYRQDRRALMDTIAFGRRWDAGPPQINDDSPPRIPQALKYTSERSDQEQPAELPGRADRRSLMQYSRFDWSKVPRVEERRLEKEGNPEDNAQIVTVRFR